MDTYSGASRNYFRRCCKYSGCKDNGEEFRWVKHDGDVSI